MRMIKDLFSMPSNSNSLGICLSGGGALGFAHIGVLQALDDRGVSPDQISGSSMGAVVGAMYAAGYKPSEILQMISDNKFKKISKIFSFKKVYPQSDISSKDAISNFIRDFIPHNSFSKMKKKLHICMANLTKSRWEIIQEGEDLDKWIAASASIPGIFEPVEVNNNFYVDGGLLNNMPAQGMENECSTIIGVDLLANSKNTAITTPVSAFTSSLRVMQSQNSIEGREICRYIIEPDAITQYNETSFNKYLDIFENGYNATVRFIEENPEIFDLRRSVRRVEVEKF